MSISYTVQLKNVHVILNKDSALQYVLSKQALVFLTKI